MFPTFQLPTGYCARDLRLALTRCAYPAKGWQFVGRDAQGLTVPARDDQGCIFRDWKNKEEALFAAQTLCLPPMAVWNPRKRAYDGLDSAYKVWVTARKDAA